VRLREKDVIDMLGRMGRYVVDLAYGHDDSKVVPYRPEDAKSVSRELTFQEDVYDFWLLSDVLLLLSMSVIDRASSYGLHGSGVSLKVTYSDMKGITRSRVTGYCDDAISVHKEAVSMLEEVSNRPIRLIGVGIYNLTDAKAKQTTLDSVLGESDKEAELQEALAFIRKKYKIDTLDESQASGWENLHMLAEHMRTHRQS
jgi:DNA polymerase-4/DNA polymerase IV (DinB-like DNA polymerase)